MDGFISENVCCSYLFSLSDSGFCRFASSLHFIDQICQRFVYFANPLKREFLILLIFPMSLISVLICCTSFLLVSLGCSVSLLFSPWIERSFLPCFSYFLITFKYVPQSLPYGPLFCISFMLYSVLVPFYENDWLLSLWTYGVSFIFNHLLLLISNLIALCSEDVLCLDGLFAC